MRGKRLKQYKKFMQIYQNVYGFREPFQILLDGTIIVSAERYSMSLVDLLPKILGGPCKLIYTSCIITELEEFGEVAKSALRYARKNLEWRKCEHKDNPISAKDCITDMVNAVNPHKFCVGSQDLELRKVMRRIPGVPLLYIKSSVCILEPPSQTTSETADQIEIQKTLPVEFEKIKNEKPQSEKKRKRKLKEPNPLSCKKKKITEVNLDSANNDVDNNRNPKKRGSRGKKHKNAERVE
jgi:U3 small nucleolar RNA-associated protein 23